MRKTGLIFFAVLLFKQCLEKISFKKQTISTVPFYIFHHTRAAAIQILEMSTNFTLFNPCLFVALHHGKSLKSPFHSGSPRKSTDRTTPFHEPRASLHRGQVLLLPLERTTRPCYPYLTSSGAACVERKELLDLIG